MNGFWAVAAVVLTCLTVEGNGANILVMLPQPLFSHTNSFMPVVRELAVRGHNVTLVSPFPEKQKTPNLNQILVRDTLETITAMTQNLIGKPNFLTNFFMFSISGKIITEAILNEPSFQNFLRDSSKFDLVIAETFGLQEIMVAFGNKYKVPVVNFHPNEPFFLMNHYTGNTAPYSYIPSVLMIATDHMTFWERLETTVTTTLLNIYGNLVYLEEIDSMMRAYMNETNGFGNLPHIKDMLRKTSLSLLDYHFSVGYQKPYHTNIVEIGGLTLQLAKPLPEDLQKFMDNSKEGVIYFSFGSYLNVSTLPGNQKEVILDALTSLKQEVIMKWPEDVPDLPPNIRVGKWFPQPSILAHPKCKLFITHGGMHGLYETLNFGVPAVGIPIYGDQQKNMKFAELKGFALSVDRFEDMTKEKILQTVNRVLKDPKFKAAAERRSAIMKDRPMPPLETAIWWIEYVLRHEGAPHLQPASIHLYWFQYLLLDVIATLLLLVTAPLLLLYYTFKFIISLCFKSKRSKHKLKKS